MKFVSNTRSKPIWRSAVTILPGDQRPRGIAEAFAQRCADGGGSLHDAPSSSGRPGPPTPRPISSRSLIAPTGHTAAHCPHCTQTTSESGWENAGPIIGLEPAALREDGRHSLRLAAHGHAPAAGNALGRVAHERGRARVRPPLALHSGEGDLADAQVARDGLKLAVRVAVAGLAVALVIGEDQLHHGPPRVPGPGGVGLHLHPFAHAWSRRKAIRVLAPSTSTRHTRQAPMACTFFR